MPLTIGKGTPCRSDTDAEFNTVYRFGTWRGGERGSNNAGGKAGTEDTTTYGKRTIAWTPTKGRALSLTVGPPSCPVGALSGTTDPDEPLPGAEDHLSFKGRPLILPNYSGDDYLCRSMFRVIYGVGGIGDASVLKPFFPFEACDYVDAPIDPETITGVEQTLFTSVPQGNLADLQDATLEHLYFLPIPPPNFADEEQWSLGHYSFKAKATTANGTIQRRIGTTNDWEFLAGTITGTAQFVRAQGPGHTLYLDGGNFTFSINCAADGSSTGTASGHIKLCKAAHCSDYADWTVIRGNAGGTITTGGTLTVTDSNADYPTNALTGLTISASGQTRTIASNTTTSITVTAAFNPAIQTGASYGLQSSEIQEYLSPYFEVDVDFTV